MQPQTPEPAGMRRAIAVLGPSREVRALLGLAASAALDRGGVHQPHVVVPRLALACEASHDTCDHVAAAPQPLVVAVAVGQIGEPRPQMRVGEAHELRLVVIAQQRRDHRQSDQLRVRQLRGEPHHRPLGSPPRILRQQVIDPHIQCGREGVQVRVHAPVLRERRRRRSARRCGPPRSRCCFTPRAWTPSPHHRWTRPLGTNHLVHATAARLVPPDASSPRNLSLRNLPLRNLSLSRKPAPSCSGSRDAPAPVVFVRVRTPLACGPGSMAERQDLEWGRC